MAESFLRFTPRVQFRDPGFVFMEVSSTSELFGGERSLLDRAMGVSRQFFPLTQAAIANNPSTAQVLSFQPEPTIALPSEEIQDLGRMPITALKHLEGLIAWRSHREIDHIVDFFLGLGFHKLEDLRRFQIETFRERWAETGELIWRRLHGRDTQVISPLLPAESLADFIYLDFPISLMAFLLHSVERSLQLLFSRLQGRGEFARTLRLHLYCEYSNLYHLVEISPARPCRDLELFLKLIKNKLSLIDLENPIRQFELEVIPAPEAIQQFDFWQPRVRDTDKLHQLVSVLNQSSVNTGYLKPQSALMPEDAWSVTEEYEEPELLDDELEILTEASDGEDAFSWKPAYGRSLYEAPRPSLLLDPPEPLGESQMRRLQFLSSHPIERLEDQWWENSRGRDYSIAISPEGQILWVYFDRIEQQHYLHGYFD